MNPRTLQSNGAGLALPDPPSGDSLDALQVVMKLMADKEAFDKEFMDKLMVVQNAIDEKDRTLQRFVTYLDANKKASEDEAAAVASREKAKQILNAITDGKEMTAQIKKKKNKPGKRQRDAAKAARARAAEGAPQETASGNPPALQTGKCFSPPVLREGPEAGREVTETSLETPAVDAEPVGKKRPRDGVPEEVDMFNQFCQNPTPKILK